MGPNAFGGGITGIIYENVKSNYCIFILIFQCVIIMRMLLEFYVDYLSKNPNLGEEPVDIEDLVNIGRASGPYVFSTVLHPFCFFPM